MNRLSQRTSTRSQPWRALLLAAALPLSLAAQQTGAWVTGITEPVNDVTLSASLAGIVGKRPFKEGDRVKSGEAAIELDKRLEELEVERRKLAMDLKKTDLDSTRALFEKKALSISREEMDKRIAEYNIAAVEFELAKEQLQKRRLTSPFEGMVVDLPVKEGEACQAHQPLVRIVDPKHCYFVTNLDAKSGHKLKVGRAVKLQVEAGAESLPFNGTITFVSPVVDPASGLMKVKVSFENPEERIRPGVSGKMLLEEN